MFQLYEQQFNLTVTAIRFVNTEGHNTLAYFHSYKEMETVQRSTLCLPVCWDLCVCSVIQPATRRWTLLVFTCSPCYLVALPTLGIPNADSSLISHFPSTVPFTHTHKHKCIALCILYIHRCCEYLCKNIVYIYILYVSVCFW